MACEYKNIVYAQDEPLHLTSPVDQKRRNYFTDGLKIFAFHLCPGKTVDGMRQASNRQKMKNSNKEKEREVLLI
jgi:hypothetical protein